MAAAFLLSAAACSKSGDGPTEDQISSALALKLPDGVDVTDVDIQVSENDGTKVEPVYKTRAKVELKLSENFYEVTGHILDKDVVRKTLSEGDTMKGTVITSATQKPDDSWDIAFDRMDIPAITGIAENKLTPHGYVEQGSSDYDALVKKNEQEVEKATKLAAQQAAEQAKERQERISNLSKAIVGSWASRFPAFHNGQMWAGSQSGRKFGMEVTFDPPTGNQGQGSGVIYDFENPAERVSGPIGYVLDDSGKFVTFNFPSDLNEPVVGFTANSGSEWKLSPDGTLLTGSNSNIWSLQMEKNGKVLAALKAKVSASAKDAQARQALALKYSAANANGRFQDLPLDQNKYGMFFVVGRTDGDVWGSGVYYGRSDVGTAAVHAGLLKPGQAGVIKIAYIWNNNRIGFESATRNGVTSKGNMVSYGRYAMSLVEALPLH